MNEVINKINQIIQRKEIFALIFGALVSLGLILSLLIQDFNALKLTIFAIFIVSIFNLVFIVKLGKKPKEEKKSFFFSFVQNLLDNLQEGVVIYDDNFKIIFANRFFANLVKLSQKELDGLIVKSEMVQNETYQTLANIFFPFLQGEDLKIINKNPETIEVKFTQPEEKYFLISYVDIQLDQKYKLRVVLDKTQDVIEAQKKSEFMQMVSHNLLTPLSEIRWNLEAVNFDELSQENKEFISIALRIIKSTIILAESFLNLVSVELGKLRLKIEEIEIEQIIVSILDVLKDKIEDKKLKVNVEIEETMTKLLADRSILSLALFALIENAVLYNRPGGSINITVQKLSQRPYVEIIVKDTGVGMTKKDLANLFKKFYRGEKSKEFDVKGFGIGLYNARNLINIHGGEIKIESQENIGTTATIILPLDPNLIPSYKAS